MEKIIYWLRIIHPETAGERLPLQRGEKIMFAVKYGITKLSNSLKPSH